MYEYSLPPYCSPVVCACILHGEPETHAPRTTWVQVCGTLVLRNRKAMSRSGEDGADDLTNTYNVIWQYYQSHAVVRFACHIV